jgi:hypothetical protein
MAVGGLQKGLLTGTKTHCVLVSCVVLCGMYGRVSRMNLCREMKGGRGDGKDQAPSQ